MADPNTTSKQIIVNVEKAIVGKRRQIILTLVAWLSEGHILLEDVPGVAKTVLVRALAKSVNGSFKRIQCTPDLLPTDVTGVSIFNQKSTEFEFRPGPIFAQLVLADEVNRATPRTQSALLEAMAERRVTVDGITHELAPPFLVMATQNPIDHEGTFPLPEAQLDRFLIRLSLGYPSMDEEIKMLEMLERGHPIDSLQPVVSMADLLAAQRGPRSLRRHQGPPLPDGNRSPHTAARRRGAGRKSAGVAGLVPHLAGPGRRQRSDLRAAGRREEHGRRRAHASHHPPARKPLAQGHRRRGGGGSARCGARAGHVRGGSFGMKEIY